MTAAAMVAELDDELLSMQLIHPTGSGRQSMTSTLESLREHLQWAVELEQATLPPYPCALYSLCRCGHWSNKSLCDSTHREIKFREA